MTTPRSTSIFLATVVVCALVACDSTRPTTTAVPAEVRAEWDEARERASSGKYFRRVEALDDFIATEPPTMVLLEAKALRDKYQAMADKQVVFDSAFDAVDSAVRSAANHDDRALWNGADLTDFRALLVRQLVTEYEVHGWGNRLDEAVTLPGRAGKPATYPTPARLDLARLRGSLNKLFAEMGQPLERDCVASCLNDTVDRKLFEKLGGELFLGLGKLDGPRLDRLAEAFWIEPNEELMGVPAANYYAVFSRLPRDLYTTRMAIADYGDEQALNAFTKVRSEMRGPIDTRVTRHYRMWTREAGLNQALEGKVEYRLIDSYVGFWLRRMYGETEPVVMKWLTKTLQTYDPEFLAGFDAGNDEAAR